MLAQWWPRALSFSRCVPERLTARRLWQSHARTCPWRVGLMAILAGTSTIISPALLHVLLPWVSGAAAPQMDLVGMLSALLGTQLLPLLLGLTVKHRRPQLANRLLAPLELVSKVLNLSIAETHPEHPIPHACGDSSRGLRRNADLAGREPRHRLARRRAWVGVSRRTMTLTTSLRNVGLGLVIVTGNFAGTPRRVRGLGLRDRGGAELVGSRALVGEANDDRRPLTASRQRGTLRARLTFELASIVVEGGGRDSLRAAARSRHPGDHP